MSNTYIVIKALRDTGMPELQAEAVANAIAEMTQTEVATKGDLLDATRALKGDIETSTREMKSDFLELKSDVRADIAGLKGQVELLVKFMLPIGIAVIVGVVKLFIG